MAVESMTPETLAKLSEEGVIDATQEVNQNIEQESAPTVSEDTVQDIEFNLPATEESAKQEEQAVADNPDPALERGKEVPNETLFDPFVTKKIEAGGFTVQEVKDRMLKDGGITPEYAEELKKSIDPDLVDTYVQDLNKAIQEQAKAKPPVKDESAEIAARNAKQAELNKFIYDSVGGEGKFNVMAQTLKAKLPQETVDVLNAKLASQNKALIAEGMKEAVNHYKKLTGRTNTRMEGTPTAPDGKVFEFMTKAEYHQVMRSEKYKTDKTYAAEMDERRLTSRNMDAKVTLPGQYRATRNGVTYNL
jgi:hypothetical protein